MFAQKVMVYLSTGGTFCFMLGVNLIIRIIRLISPNLAKKIILRIGEKTTMTQNPNFSYEDWGLTFSSMKFVKTASYHLWLSLGQEAFEGADAPDSPVVSMEGKRTSICKYMKGMLWPSSSVALSPMSFQSLLLSCGLLFLQATGRWCWVSGAVLDPRLSSNLRSSSNSSGTSATWLTSLLSTSPRRIQQVGESC